MLAALLLTSLGATLSLQEAVEHARAHHPQLRQAEGDRQEAVAGAEVARAALFPQVTATAAYQRTTGNYVIKPGTALPAGGAPTPSGESFNFFAAGVTASVLVFDFGATYQGAQAAREQAEAQKELALLSREDVTLGAHTAYFTASATKALVAVARETFENQEKHVSQVRGFVKAGSRPAIDLAAVRADKATAEVQLINAENAYAIAKAQLAQAMGESGSARFEVGDDRLPPVKGEDGDEERLVAEAVKSRPAMLALERQLEAQRYLVGAARAAYGPQIGASSTLTAAGTQPSQLTPNWNVLVTLTAPLFQGFATSARVDQLAGALNSLLAKKDALRQQTEVEVETALLRVRAAKASGTAARDALANARERFNLAEGRYQAGVGNVIELGDAQLGLKNAAAQVVQADFGLSTARALLLWALGRD